MANHWVREVRHPTSPSNAGHAFWMKQTSMFLYHVLGYTNFSEVVDAGTYSPIDYEHAGTDGYFTGSDGYLRSMGGGFVSADAGKWVLLDDQSYPENSGWYRIDGYSDEKCLSIDFRTAPGEYPVASTGIRWFIMGEDYNTPTADETYFRLRTPHSDGWEVEFKLNHQLSVYEIHIRLSLNADWTGTGKVLGTVKLGCSSCGTPDSNRWFRYITGNTEGTVLHVWVESTGGGNMMASVMQIDPFETVPPRPGSQRWTLYGQRSTTGIDSSSITRGTGNGNWRGQIWFEAAALARDLYSLEYSYTSNANGFSLWSGRQDNARTGALDILRGEATITDPSNSVGEYALVGRVTGFFLARANLGRRATFDDEGGNQNRFHIRDGILVEWPGWTPVW